MSFFLSKKNILKLKKQNDYPNCLTILLLVMQRFLNRAFFLFFIENIGNYYSLLLHCAPPPMYIKAKVYLKRVQLAKLWSVTRKLLFFTNKPMTTFYKLKKYLPLKSTYVALNKFFLNAKFSIKKPTHQPHNLKLLNFSI